MRKEGIRSYVQQSKPGLKPNHVRDWLAFTQAHIGWTVDDWKRVMLTDEDKTSRIGSFGRKYYSSNLEHKCLLLHQVLPTPQAGKEINPDLRMKYNIGARRPFQEPWDVGFGILPLQPPTVMFSTHSLGAAWIPRNRIFSRTTLKYIQQNVVQQRLTEQEFYCF